MNFYEKELHFRESDKEYRQSLIFRGFDNFTLKQVHSLLVKHMMKLIYENNETLISFIMDLKDSSTDENCKIMTFTWFSKSLDTKP